MQNILVFRFSNSIFEPIWNRDHIDHVQITVAEALTVGRRGNYYDATGALRDMVPNHLFQLLWLVAMEPPARFAANAVRAGKAELLDAVQLQTRDEALRNAVRAQYTEGTIDNRAVEAYRDTKDVKPDSTTETYVALKLMIDNWRWAGVPFYLRTGKALCAKRTEVAIKFKQAPVAMFRDTPIENLAQNFLVLGIQPNECIGLEFNAKVPGPSIAIGGVGMTFKYEDYFDVAPSTGYETLIYDCMIGDAILYPRADGIEAGWHVVQPVMEAWRDAGGQGLASYRAGSEGPAEAERLLGARRPPLARHCMRIDEWIPNIVKLSWSTIPPRSPKPRRSGSWAASPMTAAVPLPHRRLEPRRALSPARRRALARQSAVGPRALVHGRRPLRSTRRSAQQHGHSQAAVSRP